MCIVIPRATCAILMHFTVENFQNTKFKNQLLRIQCTVEPTCYYEMQEPKKETKLNEKGNGRL